MKLLEAASPDDTLEQICDVVTFLREALCRKSEPAWSEDALTGAQHVFWSVEAALEKMRESLRPVSM